LNASLHTVHDAEDSSLVDDDTGPYRSKRRHVPQGRPWRYFLVLLAWTAIVLIAINAGSAPGAALPDGTTPVDAGETLDTPPGEAGAHPITAKVLLASAVLLLCSAFFSASEVAYFSLHKLRVRAMREQGNFSARLAAGLLEHPGSLLTTILMGNSVVNVLLSVVLAPRVETAFAQMGDLPLPASYALAVLTSTAILVMFGEVLPKILVVWRNEAFAEIAAGPLYVISGIMAPLRNGMIFFIAFLFKVTRLSEVALAPFMTDDELKSVLSEGEATGVIERDERRMIEGILEFSEMTVRELLIPRPDVVALHEDATIGEALAVLREQEYARVPVHQENLDHITGVLYAKDLLPAFREGTFELPIQPLLRKPLFVPETMTVADFVKTAQRMHMHLAIVVDEYGGTEGIVTLQDALRELVGEFGDEALEREPFYSCVGDRLYEAEGNMPVSDFEETFKLPMDDEEHTTLGGFLMGRTEKILEVGDEIVYEGVRFTVTEVEGRRVAKLRFEVPAHLEEEAGT
jgi:CBS domain containing-hemolysin-like protein